MPWAVRSHSIPSNDAGTPTGADRPWWPATTPRIMGMDGFPIEELIRCRAAEPEALLCDNR
jgi:hypothetical protein